MFDARPLYRMHFISSDRLFRNLYGRFQAKTLFFYRPVVKTCLLHFLRILFSTDLTDTADTTCPVRVKKQPEDLPDKIIEFTTFSQRDTDTVSTAYPIVFPATFTYRTPSRLFVRRTSRTPPVFKSAASSAIKPASCNVPIFFTHNSDIL